MSRTAFAALLVALLAAPAAAQIDLTGDWDLTIQSPQGTNTVKVTLTQDGETVSGRVRSQNVSGSASSHWLDAPPGVCCDVRQVAGVTSAHAPDPFVKSQVDAG